MIDDAAKMAGYSASQKISANATASESIGASGGHSTAVASGVVQGANIAGDMIGTAEDSGNFSVEQILEGARKSAGNKVGVGVGYGENIFFT